MSFKELERNVNDHKTKVEETLSKGDHLTKENQLAPDIITDQVESLSRLWNRVLELIVNRRNDLEENLKNWNTFVKQLENLIGKLNEKDSTLKEKEESFNVIDEESAERKIAEYKVKF